MRLLARDPANASERDHPVDELVAVESVLVDHESLVVFPAESSVSLARGLISVSRILQLPLKSLERVPVARKPLPRADLSGHFLVKVLATDKRSRGMLAAMVPF